jgi:hypothetical protein
MRARYLIPNLIACTVMVLMARWSDVLHHAAWRTVWDLLLVSNMVFCLYCELKESDES